MLLEPEEQIEAVSWLPGGGKDEMNFAEFPIALLSDRVPKDQRSLVFENEIYDERRKKMIPQRRIIEGSEKFGLPTATDDVVILGLIQLAKQKNDFANREVEFTRLELITLLGWPDDGKSYKRIKESLYKIKSVNYIYDNAWWDSRQKKWTSRAFSIIDNVEINDSRGVGEQGALFPSRFTWNEVVFDSFQSGFLRNIDFAYCMRLKHSIALRMYRYLGKRFYLQPEWTFDLKEFACEHVGIGRNYEGCTQIARKLQPAIEELETSGFLVPLTHNERYQKKGREWTIRFVQNTLTPLASSANQTVVTVEPSCLVAALTERGVTPKIAAELVEQHPADFIEAKIEHFDWGMEQPEPPKKPAGYLVKSIRENYTASPHFVPQAERQRRKEAKQKVENAAIEERRRKIEEQERKQAAEKELDAHWQLLTPEEQAEIEAEALAQAGEQAQQTYATLKRIAGGGDGFLTVLRRDFLRERLQAEGKFTLTSV